MSRRLDALWLALAALVLWEALSLLVGSAALASPAATVARLGAMLAEGRFWQSAAATGVAFLWALLYTVLGGLAVGLLLGLSRLAGEVAEPILNVLYSIPKITLYPVILLFFGLGLPAKVAFGTVHGIFPVIILTMGGVRAIPPVVLKAVRTMRLSPFQTIATVLLPAALPEIFTGLRIGTVLTMLGVLIGELFASDRGLGFLLMRGVDRGDVPGIMALALFLFAIAIAMGVGLLAVDRRISHVREPSLR